MEEKQEIITPTTMEMTAGEMLRNARTTGRRKREISTVAKLLCIREDYLVALEEGNYSVIPEIVYILGFARSYAVELGLDPDVVILKIKRELGLIRDDNKHEEIIEHKIETPIKQPVAKSESSIKIETKAKKEIKKLGEKMKPAVQFVKKNWMWFVGGAVALIAVVAVVFVLFGENTNTTNENVETVANDAIVMNEDGNTNSENSETTENTNVENEKVLPAFRYPVNEQFDVKNSEKGRVVLQVEKEQWIKIEDGRGSTVFTRVLVPGDVYYLPAGDNYKATFGNAGAVDVWVDGQLVNKVGPMNTRKSGVSLAPNALKALGLAG